MTSKQDTFGDRGVRSLPAEETITAILSALINPIPLVLGRKIRRWIFGALLAETGRVVDLGMGLKLVGPSRISLGDEVFTDQNVSLIAWQPTSRIHLRSRVCLNRNVALHAQGGTIELGDRVKLDDGVHLQALGGQITLGTRTYLGPYVCMAGPGNITIGDHCLIASHSSLYANNHIFSDPDMIIDEQGVTTVGIVIEEDCWLGTGVRVLDGVTIGRGSVIGAGAVVTKDIPPYSIAVGVPARVIAKRGVNQPHATALTKVSMESASELESIQNDCTLVAS